MSYEASYNPSDPIVANIVTAWNPVDAPTNNPNTINNPNISALGMNNQDISPVGIAKVSGNALVLLTAQELSSIAAAQVIAANLAQRISADADMVSSSDIGKLERARDTVIANEFNVLIGWMIQTNINIAAATSLSDLKTRQSSNPAPSTINLAAIKTAILNQIDAGSVD